MSDDKYESPWAEINVDNGVPELRCITCGELCVGEEADSYCEHIVFLDFWGLNYVRADVEEAINGAYDIAPGQEWANHRKAIQAALPENTIVLEIIEPARGGGHDGSQLIVGMQLRSFLDLELESA